MRFVLSRWIFFTFLIHNIVLAKFLPLAFSAPKKAVNASIEKPHNSFALKIQQTLKKSRIPFSQWGLIVADNKNILYRLNSNKLFNPASLTKIFTAGALLDLLSPSLQFKTEFLSEQQVKNSVLQGDLYLKGGGDPSFVSESLWNLVNNLRRTGLKTITGDLIVDDSYFDSKSRGPRLKKFSRAPYSSPTGALSFNWNTVNIYLRPGEHKGSPLKVYIDPSSGYFSSVQNQTQTGKTKKPVVQIQKHHNRESLKIQGGMGLRQKELLIYKSISFPDLWTGWNTVEFLKQRGILLKGRVKKGATPKKAKSLAKWEGKTLTQNIQLMMKYSNNFMVEMLLKNLAVEKKGQPGALQIGLQLLKTHIESLGIPSDEYRLVQASGLSRKNRFKPIHLLKALQYWHNHPLQTEFESSFALAGKEGTLKKRFFNHHLAGRIYAKTGSLNRVSGLAGFFKNHKTEKIFFIFLFNGPAKHRKKAEQIMEQLCGLAFTASRK